MLEQRKWLLPKMSLRGRTSSSLWHKITCVDTPWRRHVDFTRDGGESAEEEGMEVGSLRSSVQREARPPSDLHLRCDEGNKGWDKGKVVKLEATDG